MQRGLTSPRAGGQTLASKPDVHLPKFERIIGMGSTVRRRNIKGFVHIVKFALPARGALACKDRGKYGNTVTCSPKTVPVEM